MHAPSFGFFKGLHLLGTPIWFDAEKAKELCILTSLLHKRPARHRRLVVAEELAWVLKNLTAAPALLATPLNRWIGVGGLQVKFMAVGLPRAEEPLLRFLGAAVLVEQTEQQGLLCGLLRQVTPLWPQVDYLVAVVPALRHEGSDLVSAAQQIAELLRERVAQSPVTTLSKFTLLVEAAEVGLSLAALLKKAEIGTTFLGFLAKVGGEIEPLATSKISQIKMRLTSEVSVAKLLNSRQQFIFIDTGLKSSLAFKDLPSLTPRFTTFKVKWFADLEQLQQVLKLTAAKEVFLIDVDRTTEALVKKKLTGVREPSFVLHFLREAEQLNFI